MPGPTDRISTGNTGPKSTEKKSNSRVKSLGLPKSCPNTSSVFFCMIFVQPLVWRIQSYIYIYLNSTCCYLEEDNLETPQHDLTWPSRHKPKTACQSDDCPKATSPAGNASSKVFNMATPLPVFSFRKKWLFETSVCLTDQSDPTFGGWSLEFGLGWICG